MGVRVKLRIAVGGRAVEAVALASTIYLPCEERYRS
jgi:hypothetical protein